MLSEQREPGYYHLKWQLNLQSSFRVVLVDIIVSLHSIVLMINSQKPPSLSFLSSVRGYCVCYQHQLAAVWCFATILPYDYFEWVLLLRACSEAHDSSRTRSGPEPSCLLLSLNSTTLTYSFQGDLTIFFKQHCTNSSAETNPNMAQVTSLR